jgi:hypothetical protein
MVLSHFGWRSFFIMVQLAGLVIHPSSTFARECGAFDRTDLVEFYNTDLGHYFYTTDCINGEIEFVESGGAGRGWKRTGWAFGVLSANYLNARRIGRFYGSVAPGPNSHLYVFDATESQTLRRLELSTPANQPRWNSEPRGDIAIGPLLANPAACPGKSILRFYNRGFERGKDPNHRFVAEQATEVRAMMLEQGWVEEGPVFCTSATFEGVQK